jgi:hypothetical protein
VFSVVLKSLNLGNNQLSCIMLLIRPQVIPHPFDDFCHCGLSAILLACRSTELTPKSRIVQKDSRQAGMTYNVTLLMNSLVIVISSLTETAPYLLRWNPGFPVKTGIQFLMLVPCFRRGGNDEILLCIGSTKVML